MGASTQSSTQSRGGQHLVPWGTLRIRVERVFWSFSASGEQLGVFSHQLPVHHWLRAVFGALTLLQPLLCTWAGHVRLSSDRGETPGQERLRQSPSAQESLGCEMSTRGLWADTAREEACAPSAGWGREPVKRNIPDSCAQPFKGSVEWSQLL